MGYSGLKIASLEGAAWENVDVRRRHALLSVEIARELLPGLAAKHGISYASEELSRIYRIIETHDDPYLGEDLKTEIERQHRDADRIFVLSVLSWYKDLLEYKNDQENGQKQGLTPESFLLQRLAFFYREPGENPLQHAYPLDVSLAEYNEGGRCEPFFTQKAKEIGDLLLEQRARETEERFLDGPRSVLLESFRSLLEVDIDMLLGPIESRA